MVAPAPIIERYQWTGGGETVLRFGPGGARCVAVAAALFEEANRLRAFTVALCRALATLGVTSLLPDLPGTGESVVDLAEATPTAWRQAFAAGAADAGAILAIRGGALVASGTATPVYQLAPAAGADLIRDLLRARRVGEPGFAMPDDGAVDLAGNRLSRATIAELQQATPSPAGRVARLVGDPAAADVRFVGRPLWRAAEPDRDDALAIAVAADVASWVTTCGR